MVSGQIPLLCVRGQGKRILQNKDRDLAGEATMCMGGDRQEEGRVAVGGAERGPHAPPHLQRSVRTHQPLISEPAAFPRGGDTIPSKVVDMAGTSESIL